MVAVQDPVAVLFAVLAAASVVVVQDFQTSGHFGGGGRQGVESLKTQ